MTNYMFIAILALTASVEACFPSKYWISCLIDTCKLGGRCPGDPTAECKMEKTECDGCKPVWYTKTGQKANCGVKRNLKLCPGGEPVVHCKVDSCKWPCTHPDFKNAPCRQNYCGECNAEYFIKDAWVSCPVSSTGTAGERLPIDTVVGDSCVQVPCSIDICVGERCPAAPGAVCRPDACNTCSPAWYLEDRLVDCITGDYISEPPVDPIVSTRPPWQRVCAANEPLVPCDMKVCENKICRNFPEAVCRPDGCGGCVDTWYVDNKLVDCLSDACPPRVPIVKCVDDPCKYFAHYCPTAECRASQCGKCEAKFYVNGQEIDCAMPPKECRPGVEPRTCPWYTCPANICPSNRRLMCRIDPCGNRCGYEFIDIYNGESMPCRVFDGDGTRRRNPPNSTPNSVSPPNFVDLVPKDPQSGVGLPGASTPGSNNNLPNSEIQGLALPGVTKIQGKDTSVQGIVDPAVIGGSGSPSSGKGGFNVEPVFIQKSPPIQDPDILSLLRAFPHEVAIIPTASIQSALKQDPDVALTNDQLFKSQIDQTVPVLVKQEPQSQSSTDLGQQQSNVVFGNKDSSLNNRLIDLTGLDSSQPVAGVSSAGKVEPPNKPLYPELELVPETASSAKSPVIAAGKPANLGTNVPLAPISAGKPSNMDSLLLGQQPNPTQQQVKAPSEKKDSQNVGVGVKSPILRQIQRGVPVSMDMFSAWANL